ncbi:MAG: hypothetical protein O2816_14225, partial [Planctomycetota bacterium]|nr:hypothetical protein [Planctomycetota bacterium]
AEGLATLLASAQLVQAGTTPLRFLFRDQFAVEIDPETLLDLTGLAAGSNPWVLRNKGDKGHYRVATAAGFDGAKHPLEFHTPARSLRVVGTTFGVDVFAPDAVCICCNHGQVETFASAGGPVEMVTEDGTLFTDPTGVIRQLHLAAHQEPLRELREFVWP